ncbi:ribosome biogenesis GTPase Der [Candidatus Microgenomates bacterium]|nr:ribosome biogenesis GTPase Der [Candidatus Microgenomates bacterium]
MSNKLPLVAIIGRPNVGKSSVFNRLVGQPQAIVAKEAGTTRNRVQQIVTLHQKTFWLVDTAGIMSAGAQPDTQADIIAAMQTQVAEALATAAVILMVIDGTVPVSQAEQQIAKQALRTGRPVLLAVNKLDHPQTELPPEAKRLGIRNAFVTSAGHNRGLTELGTALAKLIPKATVPAADLPTLALVGRPNVGKSALFNQLSGTPQAIVSNQPGTTRDVAMATITSPQGTFKLLDTGGIRRPGKRQGIEQFSYLRTLHAVGTADIALLLIDAKESGVALDQKIAGLVAEAGKGLIIVVNKWDLVEEPETARTIIEQRLMREFAFVSWAPLVFVSALKGTHVSKLTELAAEIMTYRQAEFKTPVLNRLLEDAVIDHPPAGLKNHQPRLKYITQTDVHPPTFTLFGRGTEWLHWSYKRFLEGRLRQAFVLTGTPIKLYFKSEVKNETHRRPR